MWILDVFIPFDVVLVCRMNLVVQEYSKSHILRIKGVVAVENDPRRVIVQCVLDAFTIAPATKWTKTERRVSKLVVIGKRLDKER